MFSTPFFKFLCVVLAIIIFAVSLPSLPASAAPIEGWDLGGYTITPNGGGSVEWGNIPEPIDYGIYTDDSNSSFISLLGGATCQSNFSAVNFNPDKSLDVTVYYQGLVATTSMFPLGITVYVRVPVFGSYQGIIMPGSSGYSAHGSVTLHRTGVHSRDWFSISSAADFSIWKIDLEQSLDVVLPAPNGGVWDFTVDPLQGDFSDVRDYVAALYNHLNTQDYWPAINYPYYTISSVDVEDTTYVVLTISEYPIIDELLCRDLGYITAWTPSTITSRRGSSMTYIGAYSGLNSPITFYYTNYYLPAYDPYNYYNYSLPVGSNLDDGVSDLAFLPHFTTWIGSFNYQLIPTPNYHLPFTYVNTQGVQHEEYHILTNYGVPLNTTLVTGGLDYDTMFDEWTNYPNLWSAYLSSTSSLPSAFMDFLRRWNQVSNSDGSQNDLLQQILDKVSHIDDDMHQLLGDGSPDENDDTKAIDYLIQQGNSGLDEGVSAGENALSDLRTYSSGIGSVLTAVTRSLGVEWELLVALMVFAIVALLLQRRSG